jgi:hypothetical protein
MKIIGNWGLWIIIALVIFLCYIAVFLVFVGGERFDIVEENYYEKGLQYQKQIDIVSRTSNLSEKLLIIKNENQLTVILPKDFKGSDINGKITFYRPSDSRLDRGYYIRVDSNLTQTFDITDFTRGIWIVKLILKSDFSGEVKDYYFEEELIF